MALIARCNLGRMLELQGQLRRAQVTYRQALEFAAEQGEPLLPVTGLAHVGLAALQLEWNNLPGAARHLQEGLGLGQRLGIVEIQVVGHTALAQAYQAQGETSSALEVIDEAERLEREYPVSAGTAARTAASRARLWIMQGDLAAAARWAQESGLRVDAQPLYPRDFEQRTLAWLLLAQGEPVQAAKLLESLLVPAEVQGRLGSAIEILALLALARQEQGETEGAQAALDRALSLAEPEEYVRTFINKGQPMADLLRRLVASTAGSAYASDLLAAFDPTVSAGQPLVEPLSERELEVLRGIAAGLSNREIAAELVITVGTTKWHINNIFGKLQVRRRTEAVARARELGLL
jgi:LuxR family maltose regulon positive regulatory protein